MEIRCKEIQLYVSVFNTILDQRVLLFACHSCDNGNCLTAFLPHQLRELWEFGLQPCLPMHGYCCMFSCVQLFPTPRTVLPGSSAHGIFQARILDWVAISFSRGSFWLRYWTCISTTMSPEKPMHNRYLFFPLGSHCFRGVLFSR